MKYPTGLELAVNLTLILAKEKGLINDVGSLL